MSPLFRLSLIASLFVVVPWAIAEPPGEAKPQGARIGKEKENEKEKEKVEGIEVQARGPVHEAFAQPANAKPQAAAVVPKAPPTPIPETPAEQKPEGDNVHWIPGYWAWDLEKKDFLWVSGFWRVPPPGRKWVPGYWNKTDEGSQWVSGFWAAEDREQVPYQKAPPDSLDIGASTPAPNDDSLYVPGTWVWQEGQYWWRPGYWRGARRGWIWNPACYYWTPAGYIYNDGYWDYCLEDRGLLYAPVYFTQPLWLTAGWSYQPWCGVYCGAGLFNNFFYGPGCCCYYFGNYYSPFWRGCGFRPWCNYPFGYRDCLFSYYGWRNRGNPAWINTLRSNVVARTGGHAPVPHNTFAGQRGAGNNLRTVGPATDFNHLKLTRTDHAQVERAQSNVKQLNQLAQTRLHGERLNVSGPRSPNLQRTANSIQAAPLRLPGGGGHSGLTDFSVPPPRGLRGNIQGGANSELRSLSPGLSGPNGIGPTHVPGSSLPGPRVLSGAGGYGGYNGGRSMGGVRPGGGVHPGGGAHPGGGNPGGGRGGRR